MTWAQENIQCVCVCVREESNCCTSVVITSLCDDAECGPRLLNRTRALSFKGGNVRRVCRVTSNNRVVTAARRHVRCPRLISDAATQRHVTNVLAAHAATTARREQASEERIARQPLALLLLLCRLPPHPKYCNRDPNDENNHANSDEAGHAHRDLRLAAKNEFKGKASRGMIKKHTLRQCLRQWRGKGRVRTSNPTSNAQRLRTANTSRVIQDTEDTDASDIHFSAEDCIDCIASTKLASKRVIFGQ